VVVSDQLGSGEVLLFDADAIASDGGTVAMSTARHATVDMAGGNSPTFSLWQKNCFGLRVERQLGFKLLRAGAVASLSSASYTGESPA
jgi:hypothetical protein